jgi:hypothetical protein
MLRSDLVPLITAVELSGYKKSADRKMVKNITALERFGPKNCLGFACPQWRSYDQKFDSFGVICTKKDGS